MAGDVDAQVAEISAVLSSRIDGLTQRVVESVRAQVEFYRDGRIVPEHDLAESSKSNLRFVFLALQTGEMFETSPAIATGHRRAAAGVPLPDVMAAFRVASHTAWSAMVELAGDRGVGDSAQLAATSKLWQAQDLYTEAMTVAYHERATAQIVEDAAKRAALTEALLAGQPLGDYSLWEVAKLLHIPTKGPYIVVAAELPRIGDQALPAIAQLLGDIEVHSAWRLLPDLQIGIAHIASDAALTEVLALLGRIATTKCGVSPRFDNLADTAISLRYARVALACRPDDGTFVTLFDDSVLSVAAVSAPEITRKLGEISLGSFADVDDEEKRRLLDVFWAWLDNDGSIPRAATALFCHPNTVRNRLRRIEERTGRSLSVPRELSELCLAFEVARRVPQSS